MFKVFYLEINGNILAGKIIYIYLYIWIKNFKKLNEAHGASAPVMSGVHYVDFVGA